MRTKSSAAIVCAKRSSGELKIYGLDREGFVPGGRYIVDNVSNISLNLCLSVDSPRFVVSDTDIGNFVKSAIKTPNLHELELFFGTDALFNTPGYFFCLELSEGIIYCVDNDSRKNDKCLIIHELQRASSSDDSWFVTPASCYIRSKGSGIKVDTRWHPSLPMMEFEQVTGITVQLAAEFIAQRTLGFLALLNTKGAAERKQVVADQRLVKANRKRGKHTFSPYTVIHFSGMTVSYGESKRGSPMERAAHMVRGHFKRRKTGVFWWKPHVAGSGEVRKREAYIVRP